MRPTLTHAGAVRPQGLPPAAPHPLGAAPPPPPHFPRVDSFGGSLMSNSHPGSLLGTPHVMTIDPERDGFLPPAFAAGHSTTSRPGGRDTAPALMQTPEVGPTSSSGPKPEDLVLAPMRRPQFVPVPFGGGVVTLQQPPTPAGPQPLTQFQSTPNSVLGSGRWDSDPSSPHIPTPLASSGGPQHTHAHGVPSANLLINDLPSNCTHRRLRALFEGYGAVVSVNVVDEGNTRKGFVLFRATQEAEAARHALDNRVVDGARIKVYPSHQERGAQPRSCLFVRFIPRDIDQDSLKAFFSYFGVVARARTRPQKPDARRGSLADSGSFNHPSSGSPAGDVYQEAVIDFASPVTDLLRESIADQTAIPCVTQPGAHFALSRPLMVKFDEPQHERQTRTTGALPRQLSITTGGHSTTSTATTRRDSTSNYGLLQHYPSAETSPASVARQSTNSATSPPSLQSMGSFHQASVHHHHVHTLQAHSQPMFAPHQQHQQQQQQPHHHQHHVVTAPHLPFEMTLADGRVLVFSSVGQGGQMVSPVAPPQSQQGPPTYVVMPQHQHHRQQQGVTIAPPQHQQQHHQMYAAQQPPQQQQHAYHHVPQQLSPTTFGAPPAAHTVIQPPTFYAQAQAYHPSQQNVPAPWAY
jgi:hypothetical protein